MPKRDVFFVEICSGRGVKQQELGKLVASLNELKGVVVNLHEQGEGNAIKAAFVQDPSHERERGADHILAETAKRAAIGEALRAGKVETIRWIQDNGKLQDGPGPRSTPVERTSINPTVEVEKVDVKVTAPDLRLSDIRTINSALTLKMTQKDDLMEGWSLQVVFESDKGFSSGIPVIAPQGAAVIFAQAKTAWPRTEHLQFRLPLPANGQRMALVFPDAASAEAAKKQLDAIGDRSVLEAQAASDTQKKIPEGLIHGEHTELGKYRVLIHLKQETARSQPKETGNVKTALTVEADDGRLPKREQEKAVTKLVLVFFQDKSRRAISCLVLNAGDETIVVSASPAGVVPDGTVPAVDRAFLELPGKPPIPLEFDPRSTQVFRVDRVKDNLNAIQLKDIAEVAERDSVMAMGIAHPSPRQATVIAVDEHAELELRERGIKHQFDGLIEVDRVFPEGTPLFKEGKLVGLTLLGSRFLGEKAGKSYVVPAKQIVELCERIEHGTGEEKRVPKPDGSDATELKKFQGTWVLVSSEKDGEEKSEAKNPYALTFTGTHWKVHRGEEVAIEGTLKLVDVASTPMKMDLHKPKGLGPDPTVDYGIYEWKDDTLRYCFRNGPADSGLPGGLYIPKLRPLEFSTKNGDGRILYVWKRAEPSSASKEAAVQSLNAAAAVLVEQAKVSEGGAENGPLKFLAEYPKQREQTEGELNALTAPQFEAAAKARKLRFEKSEKDVDPKYYFSTGDGHTVIVMFRDGKWSGIQRIRGEGRPDPAKVKLPDGPGKP